MNKIIILNLIGLFIFQSCMTMNMKFEFADSFNVSKKCVAIKVLHVSEAVLNGTYDEIINIKSPSYQNELKNIESTFNKNRSDCSEYVDAYVYIRHSPKNKHIIWPYISVVTLMIIPYWNDYENVMDVSLYDKGIMIKKLSSVLTYTEVDSILLLPAVPFSKFIINPFNDSILNQHAKNISSQLN